MCFFCLLRISCATDCELSPLFLLVPEQVTGVGFTLESTSNALKLTMTWDSPSSELPITHYVVHIAENDLLQYTKKVVGVTTLTITVTPGNTYTFRVQAVSAVGSGTWSERVTAECEFIMKSVSHHTVHICRQCTVLIKSTLLFT